MLRGYVLTVVNKIEDGKNGRKLNIVTHTKEMQLLLEEEVEWKWGRDAFKILNEYILYARS